MKRYSRFVRSVSLAGLVAASAAALTGCYVVPLQPPPQSTVHLPVPAPAPVTFSARLYPANDVAAVHGTVMAVVTWPPTSSGGSSLA